uniref:PDZ domain-containing protein n=1 Tax=Lactuca sativa TaxID=4236 RepID=A0A9R1XKR4_LACSA|nr:hypothetical protein LSAT_V11C300133820 [Lactuca sativa]
MDALRRPNLDLSNSSPLSSIYTKTPLTLTSSTFPYKYRLSSSNFNGWIGLAVAVSVCLDLPALAKSLTIAFPASRTHERTLIETWGLIKEIFVDPTFNHQGTIHFFCSMSFSVNKFNISLCVFCRLGLDIPANNGGNASLRIVDAAYSKIKGMISTLGDPFTRIISPKEYQSFRIGSDGNVQGVGLFVNTEPETGHLVVLSYVEGSPAARAGIHIGDELIEINGERVKGISGEAAAQKLRGHVGTSVTVKVHNGKKLAIDSSFREVKLPREFIRLSPISSVIIPHRTPNGHVSKTGYVKLLAFSQTAATDMKHAIRELENQGVESYILDLRNNPGGLVKAGLDVAQIWLDGDETLVNTTDRDGNMLPISMINGHALTCDPLVILVNAEVWYSNGISAIQHTETPSVCIQPLIFCYSNRGTIRMALGRMRQNV